MTEFTEYEVSRVKNGVRVLLRWYYTNTATGAM